VTGQARIFNRETGRYVALPGATVELQPLQRQSVTDANGQYAFRDLAAGEYTIVAKHDGREYFATISVPDGPASLKNADVALLPADTVVAGVGSTERSNAEKRPLSSQTREDGAAHERGRSANGRVSEVTSGLFTIQVAASTTVRYARAMVNELIEAGYAAYLVEPGPSGPNGSYHVYVGKYSSQAEASQSARTLETALGWRMSVSVLQRPLSARASTVSYLR